MFLYFVRHGDPCYNPDSLTPLGHRQAEAIGRRIAKYGVDEIYASTMVRATQTAIPTAELMKKEIKPVDFAREDLAWNDMSVIREDGRRVWVCVDPRAQKLFATPEVRALGAKWYDHPAFADTKYKTGMERIAREADAWLASLGYERTEREGFYKVVTPNDKRIALFAHEGFGKLFLSHVLGISYPQFSQTFSISHTSLTVIKFEDHDGICIPYVYTMANDAHLYHENLPIYTRPVF